ncbi:basic helix-loop-helix domain-containing protein USF3 [Synchiropus picturatus]
MPEMTETQTAGRKPKKKKNKESHNAVERHRKEKINAGITRIGNLLPCSQSLKQSKNMILDQAFRYITELKKQNDAMLLEGGEKVQAEEIRRLRRQLEELLKESAHYIELLKAHDINILEDPTVHWKGKQRYAKVAKVTPTHQIPKGIIVYSNNNAMAPAVKDSNPGKQPSETLLLQAPVDVGGGLRVNGALLHVNNTPAKTELNPGPTITQTTPALSVVEQCVIEKPAAVPSLPPSVSYITLQLPTVTAAKAQRLNPTVATQSTVPSSSVNPIPIEPSVPPVSSLTTLMHTVTTEISQDATRTLCYTIPNNQALLRTGTSGSTQTTWTTLQMAGNTVQPVCQSLPSLEVGNSAHTVQQVTVCPAVNKSSVQPIQIQMQSQIPVQQAPVAGQTFQRTPQLRSAILNQTQAVLAPQPQCAILPPQPAIVSQPAIVAHPAIVSQTQSLVFQPGSLVPCPPTAIIPQAKAPTPTTLVPQPQAAVLPLLQTMHVLQVNPAVATPSGETAGQPVNKPNVVILQQANTCPTQSVIREEVINKTPCQHIVIIQAPNQSAPAAQNPQVGMVPVALPSATTQVPTTSISTTSLQSVGGKQLVHILPRPAQPPVNPSQQVSQASTAQTAPQTITVNGQLFSLQPLKTSEKTPSQSGQGTLQLVQPITSEEPTTNVALNSLGALSSLNQSISHGLSLNITSQNAGPPPAAASSVLQQPADPTSCPNTFSSLPVGQLHVPCVSQAKSTQGANVPGKKLRIAASTKRTTSKKSNQSKKKESGHVPSPVAISAAGETTNLKTLDQPTTCETTADAGKALANVSDHEHAPLVPCSPSAEVTEVNLSNPLVDTPASAALQDHVSCKENTSGVATTVTAGSVKPLSDTASGAESKAVVLAVASKLLVPEAKQPAASSEAGISPSKCTSSVVSRHNRLVVCPMSVTEPVCTRTPVTTACPTTVCTTASQMPIQTAPQQEKSHPPKSISQDLAVSSSSLTLNQSPASMGTSLSCSGPETNPELRQRVTSQHADVSAPSVCLSSEVKPLPPAGMNREPPEKSLTSEAETGAVMVTTDASSSKDFALSQQVYTNLDDPTGEPGLTSDRHADSPSSLGAAGGRGFSVASMLPQGNALPASSGSYGAYTFTSEQAEMLALAMLEQDSPGRRSGACSSESTALANPTTTTWASSKPLSVSAAKEKGTPASNPKVCKATETVTVKPTGLASGRGAAVEGSAGLPTGARHLQSSAHLVSYSQAQGSSQSGSAASLSVNNLIRSSSSQKPYPASSGQQTSIPLPVGTSAHLSQTSNIVLSSCASAPLANEYVHGKSALLRAQAERQVKVVPKRQAQDDSLLNSAKRHKPCPPAAPPIGHMDVKVSEHNQLMAGPGAPASSPLMPRTTVEGGGALFSSNTFMSTVVQPVDAHCPPQGPPEQIQPGLLHLPQGHPQHSAPQPAQHLGGNLYMKQHQEQQRHHLYHLQHHLMQPDAAHRHSLHQRALQEQHVQKKRGLVRGSQSGSPAGMQQKPHHMEKSVVPQQHSHPQQSQHQQHAQQPHPQQAHQQPSHQQQTQHTQSHGQPHQPPSHQQPTPPQHQQHQQQQQLQQQQQQQGSHTRQQQHLQQVQQQHFRHQEKNCEGQTTGPRSHHNNHMGQPDGHKAAQDHNTMQRMMSSRTMEQQLISPPSSAVSRPSDLACAPSRQERHRVSNYSAEALIGKSSTSGEQQQQQQQQRMGVHLQAGRGSAQDQADLRGYLDSSRGKASLGHNPQNRLPSDHSGTADIQRVAECLPFKSMGGGPGAHQLSGFDAQVSRGSEMTPKSGPPSQRGPQGQQQGGFRMGGGPPADGRNRACYSGVHIASQGVQSAPAALREQEGCQSFMQTLLSPHLQEQSNHQRVVQCCPPVTMEYNCVPGSSSGDIQAKSSSPSVPQTQKASSMRLADGSKGHISQVNSNMHAGVRASLPHPPTPHSSSEPGRPSAPSRPPTAAGQHSRQISRDTQPTKLRPGDRPRSGALRPIHQFESEGHLALPSGGGVLLSRPQSGGDGRRSTIVRFMPDSGQVSSDNNLVSDQHLTQNFGFPFIPEGGMNPPPPINANPSFIPPVSQPSSSRTPSLLPVEPQNSLPSFYPSYSPASHPSLPSDVTLQYFPNQMFTSPSAEKGSAPPLSNRFGSILSPPRPVGFAQASFPLLPEMPPMPITNSSGITPHISNFSLTSLFPDIATGMPTDGSAMPMSPLLSLSNSTSDSGKQPNRPAHNISHILGHDGSSAV